MQIWNFTVWIEAPDEELLAWSDRLFDAGGDDTSPGNTDGKCHVEFHREAGTLKDAIQSARLTLQKAGLSVQRVEIEESELAAWI